MNTPAKATKQIQSCNTYFLYSSGLFHLGNWFRLYRWKNIKQLRTLEDTQVGILFLSQKQEIGLGFFSDIFSFDRENSKPRATQLHQTSRMKEMTVVCTRY